MHRKISLGFFIFLLGLNVEGQKGNIFITVGPNFSSVSTANNSNFDEVSSIASFHAGFLGNFTLGKTVSIQPALLFSGKGAKMQKGMETDPNYFKATARPYYIELPLNIVFRLPVRDSQSLIYLGGGGYVAMGVAGKNKADVNLFGDSYNLDDKINFGTSNNPIASPSSWAGLTYMYRFDYGLNITAGIIVKKILIAANYGHGLAIVERAKSNTNDNNKNRVFSLSVGWLIL